MADSETGSFYVKTLLNQIKKLCPKVVHTCPYIGRHGILNLTAKKEFLILSSKGDFLNLFKIYDENKPIVIFSSQLTVY